MPNTYEFIPASLDAPQKIPLDTICGLTNMEHYFSQQHYLSPTHVSTSGLQVNRCPGQVIEGWGWGGVPSFAFFRPTGTLKTLLHSHRLLAFEDFSQKPITLYSMVRLILLRAAAVISCFGSCGMNAYWIDT